MRKKFKRKRKFKYKIIIYLICVLFSMYLITFISNKVRFHIPNEIIIDSIFKNNNYAYKDKENNHISAQV